MLTQIRLKSLRVRLALWGLLLLGVTQVLVSLIIYFAISTWLEEQVNGNLQITATQVSSFLVESDDSDDSDEEFHLDDVRSQLTDNTGIVSQSFLHDQLFFVRLIDLNTGASVASSVDYDLPAISPRTGGAYFETIPYEDDDETNDLRLYTLPLSYAPRYGLQVGISLDETRDIQGDMRQILFILLLFTGTLAPLSGWFLANRALVPIRATAKTASEINESDLSRRLDLASAEVELEQLVQTFNAMLDRIEGAFQRQRQFTTDAAHELRTPLSVMRTSLDVTLSQVRSVEDYQSALVSIREEVQRLSQLSNTLLSLARADTDNLQLEKQDFDLSLMLNTVTDQFALVAEAKNIDLVRDINTNLFVCGDQDKLIQVIFNLIDNAIKFTLDNGQVRVSATSNNEQVHISIEDTGIGIPLADQAHIFDRFYRTASSRNRLKGGFGLGLAITKQIVVLHGGTIVVNSELEKGTQFVVELPNIR